MSLRHIVSALGGDLYDGGARANVPYPGHSRADRSLSLLLAGDRILVTCFGGGDWKAALDHLRNQGLIDAENRPTGSGAAPPGDSVSVIASNPEKTAAASRIWQGGRAIAGTLAAAHLHLRHIGRAPPGPETARFNLETPLRAYRTADRGANRPALLLAIRDHRGELAGLEVTYLRAGGFRDDQLRLPRKHIGRVPAGSAVRIDPAAREMLVAEGFFTALSASERFGLPAWALLSTRNMRAWIAPHGVTSVLIAGDNGLDGRRSAGVLATRLGLRGLQIRMAFPEDPHGDWNDVASA
jgi:hypothetical protein